MVLKFSKFSNFKKEKKTHRGGLEKTKYPGRRRNLKFESKVQDKGEKFGRNERFVSSSFLFFLLF